MDERRRSGPLFGLFALLLLASAATGGAVAEEGNFLSNMFKYGGTTVPPSQPQDLGEVYCPPVDVPEGGAALRSFGGKGGDNASLRNQITLGRIARECNRLQDGSITVKVGVAGQVLLGPAGAPGRFEAPLQIAIKYGDKVVVSRSKRIAVAVAPGQAQGLFTVVEDGLIVPPAMTGEYDITVTLGGAQARPAPRKRKPAAAAAAPETAGAAQ
ncbi:hypothetical protein [uncultured Methylobacterium sp.]|uniref:hypothetical protein n=1 Tax=uncultured Methylobacterium sp. TaxID=157278 RepID=UPI0035CB2BA9